jgi:phosphoribosylformylglycinamidine synthase
VILLSAIPTPADVELRFGSSEYAQEILQGFWGLPPAIDIRQEAALQKLLQEAIAEELIQSAHDIAEGGLATALAESCFQNSVGVKANVAGAGHNEVVVFEETASRIVISCDPKNTHRIKEMAVKSGVSADPIGQTVSDNFELSVNGKTVITAKVSELKEAWSRSLEKMLHTQSPEHLVGQVLEKS